MALAICVLYVHDEVPRALPRRAECHTTMCVHGVYSPDVAGETRSARVQLRMAPTDDELFRKAAREQRESLSEFLVESARERSERVLADRTRFALSPKDWELFVAALDAPARARPELVELSRRPRPE